MQRTSAAVQDRVAQHDPITPSDTTSPPRRAGRDTTLEVLFLLLMLLFIGRELTPTALVVLGKAPLVKLVEPAVVLFCAAFVAVLGDRARRTGR
jgi:hypothetical protein